MRDVKHIENWIKELENTMLDQNRAREIEERLSMIDIMDYNLANTNLIKHYE